MRKIEWADNKRINCPRNGRLSTEHYNQSYHDNAI